MIMMTLWNLVLHVMQYYYQMVYLWSYLLTDADERYLIKCKKERNKNNFTVYNSYLRVKGELKCFAEKQYFALVWICT